jgi:hypothetical protein
MWLPFRSMLPLAAAVAVMACAEDATDIVGPGPGPLPPLASATWYVHTSDGQPLPALLGHRMLPGNVLEQDFLDSTKFEVNADGTWQKSAWYHRFRNGTLHSWRTAQDFGSWAVAGDQYEFRRHTGELLYAVPGPVGTELTLNLRYAEQAGVAVSVLRTTPPALTVVGRWRATALRGLPLPATLTVDPEIDAGNGIVSRHIVVDSARVLLYANNSYRHRIYYTEWEGPANGEKQTVVDDYSTDDVGSWSRDGVTMVLQSSWLQNHIIVGEVSAATIAPMVLNHGLSHGDPPAAFRYVRF